MNKLHEGNGSEMLGNSCFISKGTKAEKLFQCGKGQTS